jgi:branched-chain amino acid transport system ATP-binding protein
MVIARTYVPLLELNGVVKNFGVLEVLRGVSFAVEEGEIVGLIGANGAGKTTLFNTVSGLAPPSAGSIRFLGSEIAGLAPHRICHMGIARTFQVVRPFAGATVAQNVRVAMVYGRGERALPESEIEGTVGRLLAFVGLEDKADAPASTLGLVELKHLELARALATAPRLLLLDETFSGLTPTETQGAMALIARIRDEFRVTILWVEHVMRAIMRVAERLVVLDRGIAIAQGPPAAIAADPRVIEAYLGVGRAGRR